MRLTLCTFLGCSFLLFGLSCDDGTSDSESASGSTMDLTPIDFGDPDPDVPSAGEMDAAPMASTTVAAAGGTVPALPETTPENSSLPGPDAEADSTQCGDGILEGSEECDEADTDCVQCRVVARGIRVSGRYPGRFQVGSFDRFNIRISRDVDLVLKTTDENGGCSADTLLHLTSERLPSALVNDDQDDANPCSTLEIDAEAGLYELRVEAGPNRMDSSDLEYILVVEMSNRCAPDDDECLGLCLVNNGGCDPRAECTVEDGEVVCACVDGYSGDGETCDALPCEANQRVSAGACLPCPEGILNGPGDDPDGPDTACDSCAEPSDLVINEFDCNQPGADNAEFIELYNPTPTDIDLSSYQIVVNNGAGMPSGASYGHLNLNGFLAADEYAVIRTMRSDGLIVPDDVLTFSGDFEIQNGSDDAIVLLKIEGESPTLVDAVVYEGRLSMVRLPDGSTMELGSQGQSAGRDNSDLHSIARTFDGALCDTNVADKDWANSATPTPGTANVFENVPCIANEFVLNNVCTPCPPGTVSRGGDNEAGPDTNCEATLCGLNELVSYHRCEACPEGQTNAAGDDASGADTTCDGTLCALDEFVSEGSCVPCPAGTINLTPDDAANGETVCDTIYCGPDEHVVANSCVSCAPGTENHEGDDASGPETTCSALVCRPDEYVLSHVCESCPRGTTNPGGDDASGDDTQCEVILCDRDQAVSDHQCVPCPIGTTNEAGDNATGADSSCDSIICGEDEFVSSNRCFPCPGGTTNDTEDNASGGDTECAPIFCDADERVASNLCTPCPADTRNAAGDNASGPDSTCNGCMRTNHIVISEFDYNQDGEDRLEFIELYNPTEQPVDLTPFTLAVSNGSTTPAGENYGEVRLSGSLSSEAYAVILTTNSSELAVGAEVLTIQADFELQNGPSDAIFLTSDESGEAVLVDAVVYAGSLETVYRNNVAFELGAQGETAGADRPVGGSLARRFEFEMCDTDVPAKDWRVSQNPTPGAPNIFTLVTCDDNEFVRANRCVPCPAGTTNTGGDNADAADTTCDPVLCAENEFVEEHRCEPCPAGTNNPAGDDASGENTTCVSILCAADEFVSNHRCDECPAGTNNRAGDNASGVDTACDPIVCDVNEYVSANVCLRCPAGTENGQGDDATGDDSECDPVICRADHYVVGHVCTPCPPGSTNAEGDDASVEDSACDPTLCQRDQYVTRHECDDCPEGTTNRAGDDASGDDTSCDRCPQPGDLVISELDYNQPGDDNAEFVEIYNPTPDTIDLSVYEIILNNGADSINGEMYDSLRLSGLLPSGGFAVIRPASSTELTLPEGTLTLAIPSSIQNGSPDAIILINTAGPTPVLVDAVVYEGSLETVRFSTDDVINLGTQGQNAGSDSPAVIRSLSRVNDGNLCDTDDPASDWAGTSRITPGAPNAFD